MVNDNGGFQQFIQSEWAVYQEICKRFQTVDKTEYEQFAFTDAPFPESDPEQSGTLSDEVLNLLDKLAGIFPDMTGAITAYYVDLEQRNDMIFWEKGQSRGTIRLTFGSEVKELLLAESFFQLAREFAPGMDEQISAWMASDVKTDEQTLLLAGDCLQKSPELVRRCLQFVSTQDFVQLCLGKRPFLQEYHLTPWGKTSCKFVFQKAGFIDYIVNQQYHFRISISLSRLTEGVPMLCFSLCVLDES